MKHKNFLIRKFLADNWEFDYILMAPMNGCKLHAPSAPLAAHKLLVWIWRVEMLKCQCADQSAKFSGLVVNAEIMYYTIISGHKVTKTSQRAHMLISTGQMIDLIMEPYSKAWFTMLVPQASQEKYVFNSQILFLTLNISTIWLVGRWLMLVMQRWNRNQVYSSVTLVLVMLRWCQHHIVNPA